MLLFLSALNIILIAVVIVILKKVMPHTEGEPMGLPKGTIRSLLTLLIASPIPIIIIYGIGNHGIEIPQQYWAIAMAVIGFYFGTRTTK